jgi:hypothetical protein
VVPEEVEVPVVEGDGVAFEEVVEWEVVEVEELVVFSWHVLVQFAVPSHCSVPSFTPFPQLVIVIVKLAVERVELSALSVSETMKVLFTEIWPVGMSLFRERIVLLLLFFFRFFYLFRFFFFFFFLYRIPLNWAVKEKCSFLHTLVVFKPAQGSV